MARHKHQVRPEATGIIIAIKTTPKGPRIEQNVVIPPIGTLKGDTSPYKLIARLKTGECVYVPTAVDDRRVMATRLGAHANKKYGNGGYTVRQQPDGVRVWRLR